MNTPHPRADLLIAIAQGKQMQGACLGPPWIDIDARDALSAVAQGLPCRIKPETVMVNGVECPKPVPGEQYIVRITMRNYAPCVDISFAKLADAETVYRALIKPFKESE